MKFGIFHIVPWHESRTQPQATKKSSSAYHMCVCAHARSSHCICTAPHGRRVHLAGTVPEWNVGVTH